MPAYRFMSIRLADLDASMVPAPAFVTLITPLALYRGVDTRAGTLVEACSTTVPGTPEVGAAIGTWGAAAPHRNTWTR